MKFPCCLFVYGFKALCFCVQPWRNGKTYRQSLDVAFAVWNSVLWCNKFCRMRFILISVGWIWPNFTVSWNSGALALSKMGLGCSIFGTWRRPNRNMQILLVILLLIWWRMIAEGHILMRVLPIQPVIYVCHKAMEAVLSRSPLMQPWRPPGLFLVVT